MKRRFALFALMTFVVFNMAFAQEQEKPLLTFGCLSDLHSQETLISGDVEQIRLRGTVTNTLKAIKEQENLDLLVLGGDYLSDVSIPEKNYLRMRELLIEAARGVFPDGAKTPVIYVNGNHEYEVANFDAIPKKYNAGEYYETPMKTDIGALDSKDCFYEMANNGNLGTVKLLAAYHYVVKGIDFVVLNTGKNFFGNAWNYVYSDESVGWCADKLAEIYADDKDKTVFFLVHLPFADSNSISSAGKGMTGTTATILKRILAKYPNLIMLYGHDHGTDSAYIRENTAQRVTVYDSNGNVWSDDGGAESESTTFYIKNAASGEYLTYDNSSNLKTVASRTAGTVASSSVVSGTFSISFDVTPRRYVHCGSSGRFSGNENLTTNSSLYVYKVDDSTAKTGTAKRVTTVEAGASYIFVTLSSAGGYYMMTNEPYGSGSGLRMIGTKVSSGVPGDEITFTQGDKYTPVWTFEEGGETEGPSCYYIQNYTTGKYLGFNSYNLANTDVQISDATITPSATKEGAFNIHLSNSNNADNSYLYCGTSGRFSGNSDYNNEASQILAFEVDDPAAETVTATQVTEITPGKTYMLVCYKSGVYYALTNKMYKEGTSDQRMTGVAVRTTNGKITHTPGNMSALWTINAKTNEPGTRSFFSSFMGSMRYYNNSIDGNVSVSNSKIVQALIVYVYSDRVELTMKNYGQSGTINGIKVNKALKPYVTYRKVTHSDEAVTATPSFNGETGGNVETGKPVKIQVDAPLWHNVYYTVDGSDPTESSLKAEGGVIEWTPQAEGEYVVKVMAQEGIRLPSETVSSQTYRVEDASSSSIGGVLTTADGHVRAISGGISVCGYTGTVRIYNVLGEKVSEAAVVDGGDTRFFVGGGVYVVQLDTGVCKVVVL